MEIIKYQNGIFAHGERKLAISADFELFLAKAEITEVLVKITVDEAFKLLEEANRKKGLVYPWYPTELTDAVLIHAWEFEKQHGPSKGSVTFIDNWKFSRNGITMISYRMECGKPSIHLACIVPQIYP